MNYLVRYGFLLFTIILTLVGYFILINSANEGLDMANDFLLHSMGGSMDTGSFHLIIEGYILSNVVLGGITFAVGLIFLCVHLYKMTKSINEYNKS